MEKYKKYYGVICFAVVLLVLVLAAYYTITPQLDKLKSAEESLAARKTVLETKQNEKIRVANKLRSLQDSVASAPKKVYVPTESDLGNETLFFTMYNDLLETIHANSVKIRSLDYSYNPANDAFVQNGKDIYLVCDVNMELVSNYVNLGKLVQDIYQYPYYIKINDLTVKPYEKDKKILVANLSLRLYAHTAPLEEVAPTAENSENFDVE